MGTQIFGNTNSSTAAEVELNTKALRTVIRPDDYGGANGGIYRLAVNNGATGVTAGLTTPNIFAFRNGSSTITAIVKRVQFDFYSGGTGFAAGQIFFPMLVARSWTVGPSTGTDVTPTGNGNKLRTSPMATSNLGSGNIRCATTASITTGTLTLDTNPIAQVNGPTTTATWTAFLNSPNTVLLDQRVGEFPLVLGQNEGFVIQPTIPATGVWFFGIKVDWEELTSY